MENGGARPARGKSRKPKERVRENSSGKRPPVLHSEEGEGGGEKLPASKGRAKSTRRAEREPSPDQEEDVIDGFVIVSYRAEESLKNALKKHCNVYENRIMQLPQGTRGPGSSSWRGVGDGGAGSTRACTSSATAAAATTDAAGAEESTKPSGSSKGSSGHSNKGKENKAMSAATAACVPPDTSASAGVTAVASGRLPPPLHSSSGSPTPVSTCCNETSTASKSENAKKGAAASSKLTDPDVQPLAAPPTKSTADQGPPPASSSSSAGPPELSAAVNSSGSLAGDHPASPAASEGTCQSSCAAPSPLHLQVPLLGLEAPPAASSVASGSGGNKEFKSSKSDSIAVGPAQAGGIGSVTGGGVATAARNGLWPSSRSGESKTRASPAAAGRAPSAGPAGMAWHTPVDGSVTAASSSSSSSMNLSQPFYSAYTNPLAAMLGMASAPATAGPPGAPPSALATPHFMANALAAAAAAGLTVMQPTGYAPDFAAAAYNTQDLQRELSCRFLDSQVDRSALATLQPYLPGSSATAASSIPHQQLYDQLLRTAAAAQQQQQQHQAAAAAAAVAAAAAAAAAGMPPPPYGTSLVPTPAPHMYAGKAHKFDAATMALWGPTMPGAFPPALAATAAAMFHGSAPAAGTSPFQSIATGIGPLFGDTSANFTTKKSGRWCAAHVKIAWQIFQSQQRSKLEQQNGVVIGGGGGSSALSALAGVKSEAAFVAAAAGVTHLASVAAASAAAGTSGSSSRSSASLSAPHDASHHRSGSSMPPMLSSVAGTPPSNSTRSPHSTNLNYSPAAAAAGAAFPAMASSRDIAEWTAHLRGAAALLSLAPAVMGWPNLRPDSGTAKESMASDRSSLAFGFGRELNGGTDSADSRESNSRGSGSNGRSASHRPRSRSPIRAKSREASSAAASADRVRVKTERRDHAEDHATTRSGDRLVSHGGAVSAAAIAPGVGDLLLGVAGAAQHQQHLLQQQAASVYGCNTVPDAFNCPRWLGSLIPPVATSATSAAAAPLYAGVGSAALSLVGDRRLWSPFERNASFESNRGRPHSSAVADTIIPAQDVDHRHGATDRLPHMDYRLAAAAAVAETRVAPFSSGGGSAAGGSGGSGSRMKLSASGPYLASGLGSTVPGAAVHPSIALNGHRSASATPSHGGVGGSGRDRQSSPAGSILSYAAAAAAAAATVGMHAPMKAGSPGQPCQPIQVNGGGASLDGAAAESEAHSR